ncbi:hypothetical protein ACHAXT_000002 [Thalassiosira profunda]
MAPTPRIRHDAAAAIHSNALSVCSRCAAHVGSLLLREFTRLQIDDVDGTAPAEECHLALAHACLRRLAHRHLDKCSRLSPLSTEAAMEEALKFHALPDDLREKLATQYGRDESDRPSNWHEALGQLKALATTTNTAGDDVLDKGKLWRLVLDHSITSYVPIQCRACGHVVPDQYPLKQSDAEVGLREVPPTGDELELRGGWFRGPRKAVTFELTCPKCRHISKWYRSGHPKIILNPDRWGRLCGEQEDLRWALAAYLDVPVRIVVPLDWDHVWSEYSAPSDSGSVWNVLDGSARNFCCRLDEGIGSWTRVLAIHPDPRLCEDVTRAYLSCRRNGGRADDRVSSDVDGNRVMRGYEERVQAAREDASGDLTQAKTANGHVLERARMTDEEITTELRRAAGDYGTTEWWQLTTNN